VLKMLVGAGHSNIEIIGSIRCDTVLYRRYQTYTIGNRLWKIEHAATAPSGRV